MQRTRGVKGTSATAVTQPVSPLTKGLICIVIGFVMLTYGIMLPQLHGQDNQEFAKGLEDPTIELEDPIIAHLLEAEKQLASKSRVNRPPSSSSSSSQVSQHQRGSKKRSKTAAASSSNSRLLGLVMIVKNEAYQLRPLLESVRPFIDYWVILDTGSTDGTQDLIRQELKNIPGELHEEPFIDYSTSRNRALELYGRHTTYRLMLDGGDTLENGADLREFLLSAQSDPARECFGLEWIWPDTTFFVPLICRTDAQWQYFGRVHNYLAKVSNQNAAFENISPSVARVQHDVPNTPEERQRKRGKWERDLEVLQQELARDPSDSRASFYLAQTYSSLQREREAFLQYAHTYAIPSFPERLYQAAMRAALHCVRVGEPWQTCQDWYLRAYKAAPSRAEPYLHIARHYRENKEYAQCCRWARLALSIPYPQNALFDVSRHAYEVEIPDEYSVCAYWIGEHELGLAAAQRALRHETDPSQRERLQANVNFHLKKKKEQQQQQQQQQQGRASAPTPQKKKHQQKSISKPKPTALPSSSSDVPLLSEVLHARQPTASNSLLVFGLPADPSFLQRANVDGHTLFIGSDLDSWLPQPHQQQQQHARQQWSALLASGDAVSTRFTVYQSDALSLITSSTGEEDPALELLRPPVQLSQQAWNIAVLSDDDAHQQQQQGEEEDASSNSKTSNQLVPAIAAQGLYAVARVFRQAAAEAKAEAESEAAGKGVWDVLVGGCTRPVMRAAAERFLLGAQPAFSLHKQSGDWCWYQLSNN